MSIKEMVDRIVEDGILTDKEYRDLLDAVNADGKVDAEEEAQLQRVLDMIKSKKLKVI